MSEKKFLAGFGLANITPEESVPMASYGDDLRRFSEGKFTELEARALAVTDAWGESIVFITCDLSWCPSYLGDRVLEALTAEKLEESRQLREDMEKPLRKLLSALNKPGVTVNESTLAIYAEMRTLYDDDIILIKIRRKITHCFMLYITRLRMQY